MYSDEAGSSANVLLEMAHRSRVVELLILHVQVSVSLLSLSVFSLPSNRRHLSCDDCLEDKREDYQNCSVLYCAS